MNRTQHIVAGLVVFAIYTYLVYQIRSIGVEVLFLGGVAAILGSMLPDIIEPASDWTHRGFAHSKRILRRLSLIVLLTSIAVLVFPHLLILVGALLAYVVHLLCDWTTKVGLPT